MGEMNQENVECTSSRMSKAAAEGQRIGAKDETTTRQAYDLEERTARFGEAVIRFARTVPLDSVTRPLIDQLVRAGTSVGANYAEADDAQSKADFRHKVAIAKKEARETKHWLRMIVAAVPETRDLVTPIWREARELHLIFATIRNTTGRR